MTIPKLAGPFLVLFAAMLWATDAPFRVHLTADLPSSLIVLGEHFVSVILLLPLLASRLRDLRGFSARQWAALLFVALCGSALASVAFTEAFRYVNPSVAILLQKLQPLIAIGLSALVLRESLSRSFFFYAALALFGAYLISFPTLIPVTYPGEAFTPHVLGITLALLAALFWGASTVFGRYLLGTLDFKAMTAFRFLFAFLFLLMLAAGQGTLSAVSAITGTDALFIIIIALVSGVTSLFIYYRGLADTPASVATLAELGFPLAAVAINWIFLDAALLPAQLFGAALLFAAMYRLARENAQRSV